MPTTPAAAFFAHISTTVLAAPLVGVAVVLCLIAFSQWYAGRSNR